MLCPNHTQVDGHQRARWPPTTQSPSHRTRQPSERRPSESTMAAYHSRLRTEPGSHQRDGHQRARWPSTTQSRLPHKNPSVWTTRPSSSSTPPVKPRGREAEARQPISTRKAPSQKKAPLYASHGRVPDAANTWRTWRTPFTLDPGMAKKGILGQKAHPR